MRVFSRDARPSWPLSRLSVALILVFGPASMSMAQETPAPAAPPSAASASESLVDIEFNEDFAADAAGSKVDFSRFSRGNPLLPGDYRVDLSVNGKALGRTEVSVKASPGQEEGRFCVTRALLERLGVDFEKLGEPAVLALAGPACLSIKDLIPDASLTLDTSALSLEASIPQALLRRTARGYVDPAAWDSGVTAAVLGYAFNSYRNRTAGQSFDSSYLGLNLGFNAGGWNFRHNGGMSWPVRGGSTYQTQNTYVQRDLSALRGRLTLGEANTSGEIFDTVPFLGAQVASDDRMLPDSQRGYAPVVRGIATTQARVTIRQSGVIIYDTPVAPGPFEIDDLFPAGYGGDLEVTVTESDGRQRVFSVPYAAVPQLLRPDTMRFSATGGRLRNPALLDEPGFFQGTLQRGFTNRLTGYGGVQAAEHYAAALLGAAVASPIGALSADLSAARSEIGQDHLSGHSLRLGYSKFLEQFASNVSVSAARFSTDGFFGFSDAALAADAVRRGLSADSVWRPRNRLSLSFSQALGENGGHLSLSGFAQDYWNRDQRDLQYQFSYTNRFRSMSYTLSINRTRDAAGRMANMVMASLSIPLGRSDRPPMTAMLNVSRDADGRMSSQASLSGTAGASNELGWGVAAGHAETQGASGSLNAQYRSRYANLQAFYGQGRDYRSGSLGVNGSAVLHAGGLTLSPYLGETIGLVEAPDAAGARIEGYSGVVLDGKGFGVVPYMTPYRLNEVAIDPKGISADVELQATSQQVAPRAGAVVRLQYKTTTGRALLVDSRLADGARLPFGADVRDAAGHSVGTVGQGGRIFVRMPESNRLLTVRWGEQAALACSIDLSALPARVAGAGAKLERFDGPCTVAQAAAGREPGAAGAIE
ncbi:fimbria/pilus outer membrane usher protein [Variovorax saccharolyticus]|uniref:fimbria/pilus outer membrane usher protein n=1 Tax=Variovorax saccharolyticus TaxID=3053516 RepID=UPI002578D3B6|nr:fimbria/pilus outer membrane usher protein [Variovorax sp. J22R187]MDM0020133.1 fimbria/pilus outer membrane usher protein [Variovorax sp. J22R187]